MSVEISSASVEPIRFTYLVDGRPLDGASLTVGVTRTTAGGTLEVLDWDAELFTTFDLALSPTIELSPLDATDAPGVYGRMFDMAFPSNAAVGDIYTVTVREGDEVLDEWEIRNTFVNTLNSRASSAALATAQGDITSILGYGAPPNAATVATQVWATAHGTPSVNTFGWLAWRLAQWGTEIAQKRIVGQNLVLKSVDGLTTFATVPLADIGGDPISPAVGEPARFLPSA